MGVVLLMATGCATQNGPDLPDPPADVAYIQPGDSLSAETSGALRREGGCVYVDADDAIGPMVAVFQNHGIRWSGDELQVGDVSYRLGERLQFGGGAREGAPEGAVIPDGCVADLFWFVSP